MSDEEVGTISVRPAFRFSEASAHLDWVRAYLMHGGSLEIAPIEGSDPPEFQLREFDAAMWPYETMALHACDGCPMGAHIREHEFIARLGVPHLTATLVDEALAAGFSAFLIAPRNDDKVVAGCYTLITAIADNT